MIKRLKLNLSQATPLTGFFISVLVTVLIASIWLVVHGESFVQLYDAYEEWMRPMSNRLILMIAVFQVGIVIKLHHMRKQSDKLVTLAIRLSQKKS